METGTVAQEAARRHGPEAAGGSDGGGPARAWEAAARRPLLSATVACVALAALSAAVLPTVPSYDPWSWVVWGREVVDPHLSFFVGGGPSWKPLPVVFTTVFALFGGAAPTLWVIAARAGGLLGLVAAYRLAARLVGGTAAAGGPRAPGGAAGAAAAGARATAIPAVLAGLIAVAGVVLTQDWVYYMFRGTTEPLLIATWLWAIDRHLDGQRVTAFLLGVATGLMRPEAWPFVLIYAVWLWVYEPAFRGPAMRALLIAGLVAMPVLWFVPPWISTGQPFLAATHAHQYNGHLGSNRLLEVLRRGVNVQTAAVLVLALIATGLAVAAARPRARHPASPESAGAASSGCQRVTVALAALAAAWWVVVVVETLAGYPGLERFYLPAAAIACVLAGVGVVEVARLAAGAARRGAGAAQGAGAARQPQGLGEGAAAEAAGLGATAGQRASGRLQWAVGGAVALALLALTIPFFTTRISVARAQRSIAARAVTRLDELSAAVAAVGGHRAVYPCHSSFAAVNHSVQTALAWKLHVTLGRVGTSMRHQGLMFLGPHDSIDGGAPRINPRLTSRQLLAQVGVWRVYRMTAPGANTRCVGR
jgi:hypothetical protein